MWWWMVLAFLCGMLFGLLLMFVCCMDNADRRDNDEQRKTSSGDG